MGIAAPARRIGTVTSIFSRILAGDIPGEIVHENDRLFVIRDIAPKAPVHLLVIPERHVETFRDVGSMTPDETKRMLEFVAETARDAGLDDYRVVVNVGERGGQTIFHLHWHVLGGEPMTEELA